MATLGERHAQRVPRREALASDRRRLSYAQLDAEVNRVANALARAGLAKGDRVELNLFLNGGMLIGATHVLLPAFDPGTVLEVMERERITGFFGVPTMYQFMLTRPEFGDRDLSAWRESPAPADSWGGPPQPVRQDRQTGVAGPAGPGSADVTPWLPPTRIGGAAGGGAGSNKVNVATWQRSLPRKTVHKRAGGCPSAGKVSSTESSGRPPMT